MFALLDHEGAPRCTGYQFETMDILLLPMTQSFAIQLPTTWGGNNQMSNRIRGRRSYKRCKMKVVPNQDLMSEHRENGPIVRELPVEPEQFGRYPDTNHWAVNIVWRRGGGEKNRFKLTSNVVQCGEKANPDLCGSKEIREGINHNESVCGKSTPRRSQAN